MPNLLNRLAGRALGVIPVAEPIVPARFSPVVREHGALNSLVSDIEQEASAPQISSVEAAPHERLIENNVPRGKRLRTPDGEIPRSGLLRKLPERFETELASRPELSNRNTQDPDRLRPQIELSPHREKPAHHKAHQQVRSDDVHIEASSSRADQHLSPRQPFTASPRAEPASAEPFLDLPTRPASPIKVTIGRIDVRAVTPPAPQASSHRRSSTVSLDQFLKQRSAGER